MATSYFRPLSMMATFSMATVVKMRLCPHHYQPRSALIHLMASSPSLLLHFVLEQSVLRPWSLAAPHRKQPLEGEVLPPRSYGVDRKWEPKKKTLCTINHNKLLRLYSKATLSSSAADRRTCRATEESIYHNQKDFGFDGP